MRHPAWKLQLKQAQIGPLTDRWGVKNGIRWNIERKGFIPQISLPACINQCNDTSAWPIPLILPQIRKPLCIPKVINEFFSCHYLKMAPQKKCPETPIFWILDWFFNCLPLYNLGMLYIAGNEILFGFGNASCRNKFITPQNLKCFWNFLDGLLTNFLRSPI